jgi:hypothetical protein
MHSPVANAVCLPIRKRIGKWQSLAFAYAKTIVAYEFRKFLCREFSKDIVYNCATKFQKLTKTFIAIYGDVNRIS